MLGCSSSGSTGTTGGDADFVNVKLGSKVGERLPDMSWGLIDGTTVESSELIAQGQPTFLFFFATW